MPRKLSMLAPGWWDYTTLDEELLKDAARLKYQDIAQLSREGFKYTFTTPLRIFILRKLWNT